MNTQNEIISADRDHCSEIIAAIRGNTSPKLMQQKLSDFHGSDIADILPKLTVQERKRLFRICTADMLSEVFEYIDEEEAKSYLPEMEPKKAAAVISRLETDTAADILRELSRDYRELLIELMPEDIKKELSMIAAFDESEIGSHMTTNCIVIKDDLSVKSAMKEVVRQADNDNISTIFVEDESGSYCGAVDLRDLITSQNAESLDSLVMTSFPYVYGNEETDDCLERLKDYSESSVPVLDASNRMIGVITARSMIGVVDDEMSEDYARLAGLTSEEDLHEPLRQSMIKRLPWLTILLGLGLIVSAVVGMFERVISQLTLIMAFQSLILDMAGNVGTQSLAVTIRVLMAEELTAAQKFKLVSKELKVGFSGGLIMGIVSFAFVGLYIMLFKHRDAVFSFAVSGCIGAALMLAMLISSAVGTLIPLFFKRMKIDPAAASGPLITTVNDLVAVVSYYGLSWLLLINVMGLS